MKNVSRLIALLLCLIMVCAVFAGCKKEEAPVAEAPVAEKEETEAPKIDAETEGTTKEEVEATNEVVGYAETVNIGYLYDLDTADPYQGSSSQTAFFTNSTFRTLTKADPTTGDLVLVLADSVTDVSGDNTAFEVKIKQGVKFHDGTELTAEDIVFTWDYAKDATKVAKPIGNADLMVKSVEVIDDYTVKFNLNYAIPDFAYYLEFKVYSKDAFDTLPVEEAGVIGCGPYKCGERVSGVSYTMERFDEYFEGTDNYPTKYLTFKVLPDDNSLTMALQAGEINYAFRIASASIDILTADENLTSYTGNGLMSYYMGFKFAKEKWQDPQLRKAIAMAINKDDIVTAQFNNGQGATATKNFCLSSGVGYAEVTPIEYDPEGAKAILKELGYENMDLTIMTVDSYKVMCEVVQAQLAQVGINATIKVVDGSNWPSLKVTEDYDIDLGDYGTYSGAMLYNFDRFFSKEGSSNMRGFYSEEFETLIANCRNASDLAAMEKEFAVLQQWVADNVPFVPICQNTAFSCGSKDLGGVVVAGSDNVFYPETLFIPIYA